MNFAFNILDRTSNDWVSCGSIRQGVNYTKLCAINGDSIVTVAQNASKGSMLVMHGTYNQSGDIQCGSNIWGCLGNPFLGTVKLSDIYNTLKMQGIQTGYKDVKQGNTFVILSDEHFVSGGQFENIQISPINGYMLSNSSTTKNIILDYKTLVWDKSF